MPVCQRLNFKKNKHDILLYRKIRESMKYFPMFTHSTIFDDELEQKSSQTHLGIIYEQTLQAEGNKNFFNKTVNTTWSYMKRLSRKCIPGSNSLN